VTAHANDTTSPPLTGRPRVLIVGGGVAGLEALLGLRELAGDRVDIELLASDLNFTYRPLAVGEPFGMGAARTYAVSEIAADQRVELRHGALGSVDAEGRAVETTGGELLHYDVLLIAAGAQLGTALPGAISVQGPGYTGQFSALLEELERDGSLRVAFASPAGVAWQVPLYELALMTSARLSERGVHGTSLHFVTPDTEPLELFGPDASAALRRLLDERGIVLHTGSYATSFENGELALAPGAAGPLEVDRVVTLPQIVGPSIRGLPHDPDGFIPVDLHGRVSGVEDTYAAGDITSFPIKQGGLATQQADAAVEHIAARAGVDLTPAPFRPVLRGMLLTGGAPQYMRAEISGGRGAEEVSEHALWWPPSKIAGRYLSPYLGLRHREFATEEAAGIPVELAIEIEPGARATRRRYRIITTAGERARMLELIPESEREE
jgi:sulfide:quinone oxidoreductase